MDSSIYKRNANINLGEVEISRRIIIDVTDYVNHMRKSNTVSGIQRVVKSIISQSDIDEDVFFSIFYKGSFYIFNKNSGNSYSQIIENFLIWKRNFRTITSKRTSIRVRISAIRNAINAKQDNFLSKLIFTNNDNFFIFGSAWDNFRLLSGLSTMKRKHNFIISAFIHDLIPYYGENFVSFGAYMNFRRYLYWINDNVEQIICNSNYSKIELVKCKIVENADKAQVVPLAHEFSNDFLTAEYKEDFLISEYLADKHSHWTTSGFVLCVGTIEARKNQHILVKAWTELAKQRSMPLLLLVGKVAANGEATRIISHREHAPVEILEGASDATLYQLYERCLFTVFPSFYEGWGLPVGESLWFGKNCIASNASSIPEVGKEFVTYFDPQSLDELKEKLVLCLDKKIPEPSVQRNELRVWNQVAIDILNNLKYQGKTE